MSVDYAIETIGGNCPVQAEGTVLDQRFYFRARWDSWSVSVFPDDGDLLNPDWYYEEPYGVGLVGAAGWMSEDEARAFLDKALTHYREVSGRPSPS